MINGYSTLGAVALHIARGHKHNSIGYNLEQAIQVICFDQRSVYAADQGTAYLWWRFMIEDHELRIDVRAGKMAEIKCIKGHRYVPAHQRNFEIENLIREFSSEWHIESRYQDVMLRMGITLDQWCLSSFREEWHTDFYGESDARQSAELLYVEPYLGGDLEPYLGGDLYLPIAFTPAPTMKSLRVDHRVLPL